MTLQGNTIWDAARLAHEANRAYCQSIGDNSQPAWADAPEWQQNSAYNGVKHLINNPGSTARESHENWMRVKEADGWHYGPVKDPERKTHPCFLPYEQLPADQQIKDHIFRSVVKACIQVYG